MYVPNNVIYAIVLSYLHFFRICNNTCRQSGMLAKGAVGKMLCANKAVGNRECRQLKSSQNIGSIILDTFLGLA